MKILAFEDEEIKGKSELAFGEGKILPVNLEQEMKNSYIDYAMSVIVSRAIPDVRDGLKPVHRPRNGNAGSEALLSKGYFEY